jgi:hypothetical protein
MSRVVHIIGNGDNAGMYKPTKGIKLTCNLPPFEISGVYATFIVDFKMMRAMAEGSVFPYGQWVLGFRPKAFLEKNLDLRLSWAQHIKEFYTELPSYVSNYTDFNCGHMTTHYAANRIKGSEIHMYGFDSMFDTNLRSCTDFYLQSDRSDTNTHRLASNWRPVWKNMFEEFPDTQFVLHHSHTALKFPKPDNVEITTK